MIAPTATVLAYLPSPSQGVWQLGPFPLRAYALCIIIGIIVAVWWGNRRWMARGGQDGEVLDVAIWAVPFGLIGGRIYHLITDWKTYFGADALKEPLDALRIWDGGLGIWGAVAFGALGAWIGARRRGIRLPAFGDAIAPPILLAQAIGRLGNYFNQELYGRETTLPWGLEIYERVNDSGYADPGLIDGVSNGVVVAVVHPTFLYELLWNVLIVVLLVVLDRRFRIGHGRLFALYVAGYCLGRFFVEMLRDDRAAVANDIAGIRPNLFTAALLFLGAVIYFVMAPKGREQGLEMYHPDRAAELEEQGVAGYVDDWYDEEIDDVVPVAAPDPGTASVTAASETPASESAASASVTEKSATAATSEPATPTPDSEPSGTETTGTDTSGTETSDPETTGTETSGAVPSEDEPSVDEPADEVATETTPDEPDTQPDETATAAPADMAEPADPSVEESDAQSAEAPESAELVEDEDTTESEKDEDTTESEKDEDTSAGATDDEQRKDDPPATT